MGWRIGIYSALLLLCAAAAYWKYSVDNERPTIPSPHPAQLLTEPVTNREATVSLNTARDKFRGRFHLVPDRRFIHAISLVTQFPVNGVPRAIGVKLNGVGWTIDSEKGPIGKLPLYPDFGDGMALLRQEATADLPQWHVIKREASLDIQRSAESFDEGVLFDTLVTLNKGYQPGDVGTGELKASASALARLAYLEDDETQTADSLYATAMAHIAIAEAASGETLTKEEGLLAAAMGYSAAAAKAAQTLPAGDPWRMYLSRDDGNLEHAAWLAPDSRELAYFRLKRLAELDRKDEWQAWFNLRFKNQSACVSCYATQFAMGGHEPITLGSHEVAMAVLLSVHGVSPVLAKTEIISLVPVKVMNDFESAAATFGQTITGPYLSAEDTAAYYRGFLYTSFDEWALYLLDRWGQPAVARDYLARLADAPAGAGQEFRRWYSNKIESESWTPDAQPAIDGINALKILGPSLYTEAVEDFIKAQGAGSPPVRLAVDALANTYDSRPSLRYDYATLLFYARDLLGREDIFGSLKATESDDDSYGRLMMYDFDDDAQSLLRIATDTRRPPLLRRQALKDLVAYTDSWPGVRKGYEHLLQEFPDGGHIFEDYLDFLKKAKDYADMQRVAKAWLLAQPGDRSIFEYWIATDDMAEAELQQGDADAAWQTLIPSIFPGETAAPAPSPQMHTSGYGEGIGEGVRVALARKDFAMAEALAEDEATTYPDSLASQMDRLSVWWTEGQYQKAADLLQHFAHPISAMEWRWTIGKTFADALAKDPTGADHAMAALTAAHLDTSMLYEVVDAIDAAGQTDTAFVVVQRLQLRGFMSIDALTSAYDLLKREKGTPAAEAWLAPKLPSDRRVEQGMEFYDGQEPELLWDMVPLAGASTEDADQVWLWRAAASVQGTALTATQGQALTAYLAAGGARWYPELGRYVLGQEEDDALRDRPLLMRPRSEASYYVALKALSGGHYREGQEWLNVDLDSNDIRNGEYQWGLDLLDYWAERDKSLVVLAARHELFRHDDHPQDE